MLDSDIITQVKGIFSSLESRYTFSTTYSSDRNEAREMIEFINDVANCSDKLSCLQNIAEQPGLLQFSILKNDSETGITFRGIPNGHEFTSLLLAILNLDGQGKNLPDRTIINRIRNLQGNIRLQTYVSLTCTNCPEIVQSLNIIAMFNPGISHEMIDGALFQSETDTMNIQAVPTVFANGRMLHVGRGSLGELLEKLETHFGSLPSTGDTAQEFDLIVLGGGPAGASAAIYAARKGLNVAMIAERIGGQVKETVGIENLISVPHTTGPQLADNLRDHINRYPIAVFENRRIASSDVIGKTKTITVTGGETFTAPAVIIATGASWRKLGVEGETEYIGRGVAFCPHCDGPLYTDRHVAVIGGGNSGIEAALDLSGICSKVTVFEYADMLKADNVLQEKVRNIPNIKIITSVETTGIIGDGNKVTSIRVKDRTTGTENTYPIDGIFVQIGLSANSRPFKDVLETTSIGEIKVDESCRTSIPGVYAAGDVSTVPYKQIIIAMGEGAKAALSAFDDIILNKI
ncbi:MAG: alkyl hydroperoxide reductase subunit F [Muribaculaceae bacterium]|nr:alkyl hydroperoxide reductase subunit F [Muribaculaceae bacterium]